MVAQMDVAIVPGFGGVVLQVLVVVEIGDPMVLFPCIDEAASHDFDVTLKLLVERQNRVPPDDQPVLRAGASLLDDIKVFPCNTKFVLEGQFGS